MKLGHLCNERGMKDHFLRWLERGQKEGDRANFLLAFEEIDTTGKIHLKNTISNTHYSFSGKAIVSNKLHQCVSQQSKGVTLKSGSTWVIIWKDKAKQRMKRDQKMTCLVVVKRNKEKEIDGCL